MLFGGGEHQVVGLAGNAVRLLAVSGQAAVVALPFLLAAPDFAIVGTGTAAAGWGPRLAPHGLLDALPEHAARAARDWERHLIEVLTGVPPDAPHGAAPRPGYDLARPLAEREQAKAAELTAAGVKASARTVRRMRYRYRDQGLWGLVDTRHAPAARPAGNVDPRVVAAAAAVIDAQAGTSTGTRGRVIRPVIDRLEAEHGPGVVPVPSRATFYRLLAVLSAGRHTFGSAVTRRQTAGRPGGVFTATIAARPGEQVQMDGTPLDVMAVMDDGVIGRPELVAAVDVATRTICAAVLRPVGAKAVDAALLLARMMVPEPMRPGWDQALAMSASRIPYRRLVSIDTRLELAAAKPVIVPDTVVIDHGKVFLSEVFLRAADTLGLSVQPAHEQTGSDKPRVERPMPYVRDSFWRGRQFASLAQMQAGAEWWSLEVAGQRQCRPLAGAAPAAVFAAAEKDHLRPLPPSPFVLAEWSRCKVGPDIHVKVGKSLYSVPWKHIGQSLDARSTATMVQLFAGGDLVKTHARKPQGKQTDLADYPPEKIAFHLRTPSWCRRKAAEVGPACQALISGLLEDNALYRLRAAQGVLHLADKHQPGRLEAACATATAAGDPSYRTVKGILAAGTETSPVTTPAGDGGAAAFLHGPDALFAAVSCTAAGKRGPAPGRRSRHPGGVMTPLTTHPPATLRLTATTPGTATP